MANKKTPKVGYDKKTSSTIKKKASYLYTSGKHKVTITERIIKTLIYVVLRIVIKPSKWKNDERKYEVIERAYKRIMSADMIFIPSSIAFYLIMAFMPILSAIALVFAMPGVGPWLDTRGVGPKTVGDIIGKFIPGAKELFNNISSALKSTDFNSGALVITLSSLLVSMWIAAGGFSKLVFTQSYVFGHKFTGGYWSNKFKGISMSFAFTFSVLFALIINVFVNKAIYDSELELIWKDVFMYIFLILALFVGMISGFIGLFKFSPRFKLKFKEVLPGALVTGIPTALFLATFGPISSMWSYDAYGSIAAIMYIGMSSLFITNFIYVGLSVNVSYYRTFVRTETLKKWTLSKK